MYLVFGSISSSNHICRLYLYFQLVPFYQYSLQRGVAKVTTVNLIDRDKPSIYPESASSGLCWCGARRIDLSVAVEVEMVIPVDDPSEPCYESETIQLLREIEEHAEREDLDWLT